MHLYVMLSYSLMEVGGLEAVSTLPAVNQLLST